MWKCKENAEGRRKIFLTHVRNRTKIRLSGFGHYCGGLSFHAYSTIRALHLSKTAALHSAVCHHDGVYLHLLRGGRCFRVQLCGLRCLCCREPHYAVSHGVGCRGLHAGYRWQCAGGVHSGSRQRKACQRDLLPADLCADRAGCRVHHRRHCLSHACVPAAGRRRDHAAGVRQLRTYRPAGPDPLYAAKHLPELSGDGGTASAGPVRHHCRRRHQHRAGRSVRGGAAMGHPPRSKKGHGRRSLSCPFLCLLTARSRRPWGCRQPETRRCRCAWW